MRMRVSWYDYEGVAFQEQKDEDVVDEVSQTVDSTDEVTEVTVMHIEMSDLWFLMLSRLVVEQDGKWVIAARKLERYKIRCLR